LVLCSGGCAGYQQQSTVSGAPLAPRVAAVAFASSAARVTHRLPPDPRAAKRHRTQAVRPRDGVTGSRK
jgi:hypothetical protein